jgi:hypothetical protein
LNPFARVTDVWVARSQKRFGHGRLGNGDS